MAHGSERGQALLETILIVPFLMLLVMVLAEFVVYFYRSNQIENIAQPAARMVARRATFETVETYVNQKLGTFEPKLDVVNSLGERVTQWNPGESLDVRITAKVAPVFPIEVLNIFSPQSRFFPGVFTLQSSKTIFVE